MAHARAALDAAKIRLAPTREETEELQRQARSGELGDDMRGLARHIDAGRTSWAEVFDGSSPYAETHPGPHDPDGRGARGGRADGDRGGRALRPGRDLARRLST